MKCKTSDAADVDRKMMNRCIALSVKSGIDREYPYAAVLCRGNRIIAESTNKVAHDHDVTRHAEVVVISEAQKQLHSISLEDCVMYVNAEPCVYCCFAMRESRIRRVVYGLRSPHMGGVSRWNVLADEGLSNKCPEVFDPPPEIVAGFMASEVEQALLDWNPFVWGAIIKRGLFVAGPLDSIERRHPSVAERMTRALLPFLRRTVFDRFGRWI
jgi:tRNA(adenine34) deaminase